MWSVCVRVYVCSGLRGRTGATGLPGAPGLPGQIRSGLFI